MGNIRMTEEVPPMVANGLPFNETAKIRKIAFVGDHLPRKCGIATFTTDLLSAVQNAYPQSQCLCVSVNDIEDGYDYPEVVRFEIEEQDLPSYLRAADFLNISDVDVVCLQHEFGIFGGPVGGHILAMLRELKMPVVTTLHTILREPKPDQRRVIEELISLSTRLVVMADRGRQMLHDIYQAPMNKIDLIPHGIPDVGFVDPTYFKDQFQVEGRTVLLTFGLLSPNKGIEYVLNALPAVLAEFPDVVCSAPPTPMNSASMEKPTASAWKFWPPGTNWRSTLSSVTSS
jgi:glycosyltransferase involved in cell wall biosynthesis